MQRIILRPDSALHEPVLFQDTPDLCTTLDDCVVHFGRALTTLEMHVADHKDWTAYTDAIRATLPHASAAGKLVIR